MATSGMRYVVQLDEMGCLIAATATVLDLTYQDHQESA